MKYYLDTNSIINLDEKLLLAPIRKRCFTSSLVISELLKNLKENFDRQKRLTDIIYRSQLKIDWNRFGCKFNEAFGIKQKGVKERSDFKTRILYNSLVKSTSIEELTENLNISKKPLFSESKEKGENFQDLFEAEKIGFLNMATVLPGLFQKLENTRLKNFINSLQESGKKTLSPEDYLTIIAKDIYSRPYQDKLQKLEDAHYFCRIDTNQYSNSKSQIEFELEENEKAGIDRLMVKYNHSLDFYIQAEVYYYNTHTGKDVKRNDAYDLKHFLYIKKDQKILSDDRLVLEICTNCFSKNGEKLKDFIKYHISS